jgi:hypothetical protein
MKRGLSPGLVGDFMPVELRVSESNALLTLKTLQK